MKQTAFFILGVGIIFFSWFSLTRATDSLTVAGSTSATSTVGVSYTFSDLSIEGSAVDPVPVKLHVTNGTLALGTNTGLTFTGSQTGATLTFTGDIDDVNAALETLTYTRNATGTDTLEISLVQPGEVFFPDNGHLYKFISGTISATAARTAATNLTEYGATGYLVTILSAEENNFVAARLQGDGWMAASDEAVEGVWRWVAGPENGYLLTDYYTNWATGEPNNSGSNEDCAQFYVATGKWNDLSCSTNLSGYVAEFGAADDPVSVASLDIAIATVNAPSVSALSPLDNATTVATDTNLTITFDRAVSPGTGNILIKLADDDSTIESIDVTSEQVSGSATTTITIDPSVTLSELTSYYIVIPATAFVDNSAIQYPGIANATTWNFTTGDFTPPTVSSLSATSTATTASISWTTDELASTKIRYGITSSYAVTSTESDTSPRVTSHTVALSDLISCATYHYQAISTDSSNNTTSTNDNTFETSGCTASTTPSAVTSTDINIVGGSDANLTEQQNTLKITTRPYFTDASSTVAIQIQALPRTSVLETIGTPNALLLPMSAVIFEAKAIVNGTTVLDSFDEPVTITYTYSDDEIATLDESTLSLYHYHNDAWSGLSDCSLDTAANTITCTAPSFSIFSLFGEELRVSSGGTLPAEASQTPSTPKQGFLVSINNGALSSDIPTVMLTIEAAEDAVSMAISNDPTFESATRIPFEPTHKWTLLPGNGTRTVYVRVYTSWGQASETFSDSISLISTPVLPREEEIVTPPLSVGPFTPFLLNLAFGDEGTEVLRLQKYLNDHGFILAEDGPGSPGNETIYFGPRTHAAVIRFQEQYKADILSPINLLSGTGYVGPLTRSYINATASN